MGNVIYLISWKGCKYFYIGQTNNFQRRQNEHMSKLRNNQHQNSAILNVYRKYGEPRFQIMEQCDPVDIDKLEQWYLDTFIDHKFCLNIAKNVKVPARGLKRTTQTKMKMSQSHKGKRMPLAVKQKIGMAHKGRVFTEETKEKMSFAKSIPVLQYSKDGTFIKEWKKISEAAKELHICKKTLQKCLENKPTKGISSEYIWIRKNGTV